MTTRPKWLPTEKQIQAAIARQRAEAMRHGSRLAGPESIYVGPSAARLHQPPPRRTWWQRLLRAIRWPSR